MVFNVFQASALAAYYTDTAGHWAEEIIDKWSSGADPVLSGYDRIVFKPDDAMREGDLDLIITNILGGGRKDWVNSLPINREEAMKKIAVAFGITPKSSVTGAERFADHTQIDEDCAAYVYALKELGVVYGRGNNILSPKENYTRAEALSVINQMISAVADKDEDLTQDTYPRSVVIRDSGVTIADKTFEGDLIIGTGVGDGEVTLENVTVEGRLLVYGGGANSVIIRNSKINHVVGAKTAGQAPNVKVDSRSSIDSVSVSDSTILVITGNVGRVEVGAGATLRVIGDAVIDEIVITGENAVLELSGNAKIANVTVDADAANSTVSLGGNAAVTALSIEASGTEVSATGSSAITDVTVSAEGAEILGSGKVTTVTVTDAVEGKTIVNTANTSVKNSSASAVVNSNGKTVAPANTDGKSSSVSSGGGGGSGGSGGSGGGGGTPGVTTYTVATPTIDKTGAGNSGLTVSAAAIANQQAGSLVNVVVTFKGTATSGGAHTVVLSSASDVATINTNKQTLNAEAGANHEAGTQKTLIFTMPANAVDDLVITHTFSENANKVATPSISASDPVNGLRTSVAAISAQMSGTSVEVLVTLKGTATSGGAHTVVLSSASDVKEITTASQTLNVTAGANHEAGTQLKLVFIMPAIAVDDLIVTHKFTEKK